VDQLRFVEMRDLVFGRLAIEKSLDVSERGSRVAFEVTAGVYEEDIVVDKLSSDDGWRVGVHLVRSDGRGDRSSWDVCYAAVECDSIFGPFGSKRCLDTRVTA
jgi:hypothetical protein